MPPWLLTRHQNITKVVWLLQFRGLQCNAMFNIFSFLVLEFTVVISPPPPRKWLLSTESHFYPNGGLQKIARPPHPPPLLGRGAENDDRIKILKSPEFPRLRSLFEPLDMSVLGKGDCRLSDSTLCVIFHGMSYCQNCVFLKLPRVVVTGVRKNSTTHREVTFEIHPLTHSSIRTFAMAQEIYAATTNRIRDPFPRTAPSMCHCWRCARGRHRSPAPPSNPPQSGWSGSGWRPSTFFGVTPPMIPGATLFFRRF